ncbi:MAG: GH32 C-terminal domain-containing protein [Candidatus Izemoplasmatales bacterium]
MTRRLLSVVAILIAALLTGCTVVETIDGGFETGAFSGWTVVGDAFTVADEEHYDAIRYYLPAGTWHVLGSDPGTGSITSTPFTLSDPWVSFLVSGAAGSDAYVAIVDGESGAELLRTGNPFHDEPDVTETYQRINLDLSEHLGRKLAIVVTDASPTDHINFDDFTIDDEAAHLEHAVETNIRMGLDTYDDMIKAADTYIKLNAWKTPSSIRFRFHVTGETGWINDPNGFTYFGDKIHLFYQHNPYQTVWGPMHWGHVTSDDFIRWTYHDVALAPEYDYETVGAFSGSAITFGGKLYLVYTGASEGRQVQAIASSTDGYRFTKFSGNPVVGESLLPANANVADFRDPKVWEKDGTVYMIVSNRNATNQYSKLLLYKTTNMTDWTYAGRILANGGNYQSKLGIMFECPDLVTLGDKDVIIVSPQAVPNHRNGDGNVYIVGNLNYATGAFENWNFEDVATIDHGFDFYAPQTMKMPDGRTVLVAWMQSWNRRPIYAGTGIAGALTLPREIWLEGNRLYQAPIREIANYHANATIDAFAIPAGASVHDARLDGIFQDLTISFTPGEGKTGVRVFDDGNGNAMKIWYEDGKVWLDRHGVTASAYAATAVNNLTSVDCPLVDGKVVLRLILDRYSCELFVAGGAHTITATALPNAFQTQVTLFSDAAVSIAVEQYDIVL